jgi:hypothetical protein
MSEAALCVLPHGASLSLIRSACRHCCCLLLQYLPLLLLLLSLLLLLPLLLLSEEVPEGAPVHSSRQTPCAQHHTPPGQPQLALSCSLQQAAAAQHTANYSTSHSTQQSSSAAPQQQVSNSIECLHHKNCCWGVAVASCVPCGVGNGTDAVKPRQGPVDSHSTCLALRACDCSKVHRLTNRLTNKHSW